MPLYEYRCATCGAAFEQLRRMQDADRDLQCPECASSEVKRQFSTFAAQMGASGGQSGMAPCGQPASACGSGRFT